MYRSEYAANLALQAPAIPRAWATPAPKRTKPARGILARFLALFSHS